MAIEARAGELNPCLFLVKLLQLLLRIGKFDAEKGQSRN